MSDDADDTRERAEDAELRRWEENRMPERAEEELKAASPSAESMEKAREWCKACGAEKGAPHKVMHCPNDPADEGAAFYQKRAEQAEKERDEARLETGIQKNVAEENKLEWYAAVKDMRIALERAEAAEARLREVEQENEALEVSRSHYRVSYAKAGELVRELRAALAGHIRLDTGQPGAPDKCFECRKDWPCPPAQALARTETPKADEKR